MIQNQKEKRNLDLSRRRFLQYFTATSGCFAITACAAPLIDNSKRAKHGASSRYIFPQGIASADPQEDAILLWTRVVDLRKRGAVATVVQLSERKDFQKIFIEKELLVDEDTDFTLRCFIDGLDANQWFYYRFITPDGHASRTGRTRTAPPADVVEPLNLAVFSCQNYEQGFFNAYRRMALDDERAEPEFKIDLCMHVGDFIYENVNAGNLFAEKARGLFKNKDGSERTAAHLPSGGKPRGQSGQLLPQTLDDYRYIYRSYLSDPCIQDARAWYPFVYIWDDHEVLNDYWQTYHPSGAIQSLKVAGNQAWFEYLPAMLGKAKAGPSGYNPATDFRFVEVEDTLPGDFDEDYLSLEPNTQAALASLSIYRTVKWGAMADIVLVDGRSYRGPRGLDGSILGTDLIAYPKAPIAADLIRLMNAGRTANNNQPPKTLYYEGDTIPNPRAGSPRASLLGNVQKTWLKETLSKSKANWRLLCNNVPMMRFGFDTRFREHGTNSGIFWTDSWDGYPIERSEIMHFIRDNRITNVVSLTGDRHAHFAGLVHDDYDSAGTKPVIPELVGAGISAIDRFSIQTRQFRHDSELSKHTAFEGRRIGYNRESAPALNAWLLYGHETAAVLLETAAIERARATADPAINAHLKYADTDAYGYYAIRILSEGIAAEFVTLPHPTVDESDQIPKIRRRVRMYIPAWEVGDEPRITNIEVEGEEPLLGIKL